MRLLQLVYDPSNHLNILYDSVKKCQWSNVQVFSMCKGKYTIIQNYIQENRIHAIKSCVQLTQ